VVATHPIRGIALAGGGPLGAIYEMGALLALGETLQGLDLTDCGVYVGVSSGSFLAAGLANGLSPKSMHRMFIENDAADDPFEPSLLLRTALGEYAVRLASLPTLLASAARQYLEPSGAAGFVESFGRLARALPAGVFDNAGVGDYLAQLLSGPTRTNDFRQLKHKLFLVATDIDTGASVPFGAPGWDDVPIARAVQASAALPGLFPPVEIGGRFYVDGALTKTLHASVALREGAKLLICVNPLVPFDARLAAERTRRKEVSVVQGGLPSIMSQTFRTLIHSRMRVGMGRYRTEYPDADVLLFEPERDDAEMFFTNVFSYSDRRRLCEHAYQRTRENLRRRHAELSEVLGRHGIAIDDKALADEHRTLLVRGHGKNHRRLDALAQTAAKLDQTLDRLERLLTTRAAAARDRQAG
jgi:predicted acylesterase/phospholipase RssA